MSMNHSKSGGRLDAAINWSRLNRHSTRATPARSVVQVVRDGAKRVLADDASTVTVAIAPRYDQSKAYCSGEQLWHPIFGIGLVKEVRDDKIEVKFGRSIKLLIHARLVR